MQACRRCLWKLYKTPVIEDCIRFHMCLRTLFLYSNVTQQYIFT